MNPRIQKEGEFMVDIMQGNFLTKSKGDDSELVWIRFNDGTSKPMRHAKKRCLDEIEKWQKSLRRLPTEEDWPRSQNPKLFSLEAIDELFGSFGAMIEELEKRKQPQNRSRPGIKVTKQKVAPQLETVQTTESESERKAEEDMSRNAWSDLELAEFLHRACGDRPYITITEYGTWRAEAKEDTPSFYPISGHLGGGKWADSFPRMRELLGISEPEAAATSAEASKISATSPEEAVLSEDSKVDTTPVKESKKPSTRRSKVYWHHGLEWENVKKCCIDDIQLVAARVGHQPTKRQYRKFSDETMQGVESICVHFGCWDFAMEAAGFDSYLASHMPEHLRTLDVSTKENDNNAKEVAPPQESAADVPCKSQPEKRTDEQCFEDVRNAAALLPDGEYLTVKKYNELRAPGALSDRGLRGRFDCKWGEILTMAGVAIHEQEQLPLVPKQSSSVPEQSPVTQEQPPTAPEQPPAEPAQSPQVPDTAPEQSSAVHDEAPGVAENPKLPALPSLRVVSLLDYDCRVNFHGLNIRGSKDGPSARIKVQRTIQTVGPGKTKETVDSKIVIEYAGTEVDLPEPDAGTIYLIDASLYEAIPSSQCRGDLVPVYHSDFPEATRLGLYVYIR